MCSTVTTSSGSGSTGSRFAALVAQFADIGAQVCALLRDADVAGEVAAIPADALAGFVTTLLAAGDSAAAAATVVTGHVDAGSGPGGRELVAGTYASTRRFLEVEAGLSAQGATALIARARDLRGDYAAVADPWLTGAVSGDAVRELTVGVRGALRGQAIPAKERTAARETALGILLPVAQAGTVADVRRAVAHLRLLTDPDGVSQAAMDAYDDQSLTLENVGSMARLTTWLTHENAAAIMTVLTAKVDQLRRDQPEGAVERTPRYPHLLAVALTETFTALLDDAAIGSHHGIAPHVTITIDAERYAAGLGADLAIPGVDDPVPLATASLHRILCDADITTVLTRLVTAPGHGTASNHQLAALLRDAARDVLYVGRTYRVVPPRLRRALETRDRHCQFPGCRAPARRCNAHHVREWENGGDTWIANTVLLCVRHHHAVHEGRWQITAHPDIPPTATGRWRFSPPERPARP